MFFVFLFETLITLVNGCKIEVEGEETVVVAGNQKQHEKWFNLTDYLDYMFSCVIDRSIATEENK